MRLVVDKLKLFGEEPQAGDAVPHVVRGPLHPSDIFQTCEALKEGRREFVAALRHLPGCVVAHDSQVGSVVDSLAVVEHLVDDRNHVVWGRHLHKVDAIYSQ